VKVEKLGSLIKWFQSIDEASKSFYTKSNTS